MDWQPSGHNPTDHDVRHPPGHNPSLPDPREWHPPGQHRVDRDGRHPSGHNPHPPERTEYPSTHNPAERDGRHPSIQKIVPGANVIGKSRELPHPTGRPGVPPTIHRGQRDPREDLRRIEPQPRMETYLPTHREDRSDFEPPQRRPEYHEHYGYDPAYPPSASETDLTHKVTPEPRPKANTPPQPIPVVVSTSVPPAHGPPVIQVPYQADHHPYPVAASHHQPLPMGTDTVQTAVPQSHPRFSRRETYGQPSQNPDDSNATHSYPDSYRG